MSKKYHINRYGEPAECHANKRDCPIGGEHFASFLSASDYSDRIMQDERFSTLSKNREDWPKKNFRDKVGEVIDEKFDISTTGGIARGVGVIAAGTATLVTPFVMMDAYQNQQAQQQFNSTPYSVSSTVHDTSSGHNFRGVVMDSQLKKSNFNHCVRDAAKKSYVVCKTSDGKFTINAKDSHETSTHTTTVGKSVIITTSHKDILTNMSLKDNQSGSVQHLETHEVGDSTNYYIPMSSVTK